MWIVIKTTGQTVRAFGIFSTNEEACAFRDKAQEEHKKKTGTHYGADFRVVEIREP